MENKELTPVEKNMLTFIKHYVDEMERHIDLLGRQTSPPTPMPRPKRFVIRGLDGIAYWPAHDRNGFTHWHAILCNGKDGKSEYFIQLWMKGVEQTLLERCEFKPSNAYALVESMKQVIRWLQKRTEGRQRQAQEILRQQQRYVDLIEAEAALIKLGQKG